MTPDELAAFAGPVELDEAYIGGSTQNMHRAKRAARWQGRGTAGKTVVFGVAQRGKPEKKSGKVVAKVVPTSGADSLIPQVQERVLDRAVVYTDEWKSYNSLGKRGYEHTRVNHKQGVYVSGDAHTNTIEGFWSLLKRGIGGVYHSVSDKHLQSYLDEYTFRYNNRDAGGKGIFTAILDRVEKAAPAPEGALGQPG
jgi:transposase-like protein